MNPVADSRGEGGWGIYSPPHPFLDSFFFFFFYKNEVYDQKISIERIRNLSQNSGNGHFIDSNFQKFLGKHAPDPIKRSHLLPLPFESPRFSPGTFS